MAQGATYYVSPSGNDANNGTSWALAKQTIQATINRATSGDTVLVADGTYAPITIRQGVTVHSVNGAQVTIIDGGGVARCVYMSANAALDGFTVTNGYSYNGGGVYVYRGTVQNCMISGNSAYSYYSYSNSSYYYSYYYGYGGGVYADGGTLTNCTISGNTAGSYGGGLY
ncbi:MAG: hypothetical protein HYV35_08430, partial [Lentisphaerae bacterium]|nr:hypothetical protein [Lentisphaerota bacterium]